MQIFHELNECQNSTSIHLEPGCVYITWIILSNSSKTDNVQFYTLISTAQMISLVEFVFSASINLSARLIWDIKCEDYVTCV